MSYYIITHAGSKLIGPFFSEQMAIDYKKARPEFNGVVRPSTKPN